MIAGSARLLFCRQNVDEAGQDEMPHGAATAGVLPRLSCSKASDRCLERRVDVVLDLLLQYVQRSAAPSRPCGFDGAHAVVEVPARRPRARQVLVQSATARLGSAGGHARGQTQEGHLVEADWDR